MNYSFRYRGGVIGYIKVARKKLAIQDAKGQQRQYEPLCLLDFFIDPAYQRQGHGQKLCNFVLKVHTVLLLFVCVSVKIQLVVPVIRIEYQKIS
jgi:GNAT superfamily N-acetyltransferase